jgi:hypothetical protein
MPVNAFNHFLSPFIAIGYSGWSLGCFALHFHLDFYPSFSHSYFHYFLSIHPLLRGYSTWRHVLTFNLRFDMNNIWNSHLPMWTDQSSFIWRVSLFFSQEPDHISHTSCLHTNPMHCDGPVIEFGLAYSFLSVLLYPGLITSLPLPLSFRTASAAVGFEDQGRRHIQRQRHSLSVHMGCPGGIGREDGMVFIFFLFAFFLFS